MNEGRKNIKCHDFITYRKLQKDRETYSCGIQNFAGTYVIRKVRLNKHYHKWTFNL